MNAEVNAYNVAQEFLRILEEKLDLDKEKPIAHGDTLVAEFLLRKFASYTQKYLVLDEEENEIQDDPLDVDFVDDEGLLVRQSYDEDDLIPTTRKAEILAQISMHPNWKFSTIQSKFPLIKHRNYITRWKALVASGGTKLEKLKKIDEETFKKFQQARSECKIVHDIDIRRWAIRESIKFPNFEFKASANWLAHFKRRHGIVSRKIQRVKSKREIIEESKLMENAEQYRNSMKEAIKNFDPRFVWSTDQMGVQYEVLGARTLSFEGERMTFGVGFSPKDRATHSYTIQPVNSLAGEIVGDFFVCLQEPKGKLGPIVENTVFAAPNLTISCSSSGKLTKSHIEYFLDKVVSPQATQDFLLTFDNWSAQLDPTLYSSRFGINDKPSCKTIIVVPEKCTSICQPCDTGLNRQLKYIIREIFQYASLHASDEQECRLTTRDDACKIVSVTKFVISAPKFKGLIRNAWVNAGILEENENTDPVITVKEACFRFEQKICDTNDCIRAPFIKCSWCEDALCFDDFYHAYHVMECRRSPWLLLETYDRFRKVELSDPEIEQLKTAIQETQNLAREVAALIASTSPKPGTSRQSARSSAAPAVSEEKTPNEVRPYNRHPCQAKWKNLRRGVHFV